MALVSTAWVAMAMIGFAEASGQAADVASGTTSTEVTLSLDGARARVVEWNAHTANRTLESLVDGSPGEDALVVVAVVNGSMRTGPVVLHSAPVPPESVAPTEPVALPAADPDSAARPVLGASGIEVPEGDDLPRGDDGELTVVIPKGVYATAIEVACSNSSFRRRAAFEGTTARMAGVPEDECRVTFKGGSVASILRTWGPGAYDCEALERSALACRSVD